MGIDTNVVRGWSETAASRRTVLRSGVAAVAGGYLARSGVGAATAQTDDNWPAQGHDPENTRYSVNTVPLRSEPGVVAEADIAAGRHADYMVVSSVAYLHGARNGAGAIAIDTGELFWQFNPSEGALTPEGNQGGLLVTRGSDGTIYTIDSETGESTSQAPVGEGYGLGYDATEQWFAPVSEGRIVSGTVGSPDVIWDTSVEGVPFRPAMTEDDSSIVVPTVVAPPSNVDPTDPGSVDAEGRLYALDVEDGSMVWESAASRVGAGFGSPAIQNGTVFWAGTDGDILAYDAETGEGLWEFKTNGSFPRSPAVTTDTVLAGSRDGYLYRVDVDTGEQIGRLPTGAPVTTSPTVVDDVAYVGTDDGSVHAFEYEGEGRLWEFDAGAPVRALGPGNDRLVVGTEAGYAVLSGDEPPGGGGTSTQQSDGSGGGTAASEDEAVSGSTDPAGSGDDAAGGDDDSRERGLFSNDGDEPEGISSAFNLTMLGFLLSVAGIIYQMLQGR